MSLTPDHFNLLITALRSDKYRQITEKLRGTHFEEDDDGNIIDEWTGHCCLGVYCAERGVNLSDYGHNGMLEEEYQLEDFGGIEDEEISTAAPLVTVLGDFTEKQRQTLAWMNDKGNGFAPIAAYLEQHRSEFMGA
jgi:hypothetical protein